MSKQRRGFTLVELLVVIAILAVLIAILLPSLANARRAAGRVACSSNMHQVALAIANYAAASKGQMPGKGVMGGGMSPGSLVHPNQLNSLSNAGYIPKAQRDNLIYDPGAQGGELNVTLRSPAPMDPNGKDMPPAHYWWNPHPAHKSAPNPVLDAAKAAAFPWDKDTVARWTQVSQIPKGRVMGMDIVNTPGSTAHRGAGRSPSASWNLAYPDGHVSTVNSADLYRKIGEKGNAPKGPVTNNWQLANDAIRVLELLDMGLDPKNMVPGAQGYCWDLGMTNYYYPPATPGQPTDDVKQ